MLFKYFSGLIFYMNIVKLAPSLTIDGRTVFIAKEKAKNEMPADYSQSVTSMDVRRESYSSNAVGNRPVREILLEYLANLDSQELKEFKWHLTEGVKKLPKCKLEKAERCDIVKCMIDQCEVDGAAKLCVTILGKMQKNNDAKELQERLEATV